MQYSFFRDNLKLPYYTLCILVSEELLVDIRTLLAETQSVVS